MFIRRRTYDDLLNKINTLETLLDCEKRSFSGLMQENFEYATKIKDLETKAKKSEPKVRKPRKTKKEDK